MPPHIHYLSPALILHIPLHHHLLRREPPPQPPVNPSISCTTLVCNGYLLRRSATRWDDSNAESFTAHSLNQNDEEDYTLKWDLDVLQQYIDSIWILKVFRGYGFVLPFILAPLVLVNGPKSFLLAMGVSIWASTFSFAIQNMSDSQEYRSNTKKNRSGRSSSRNELENAKNGEMGYKTWVESDDDSIFGGWDEADYSRRSQKKKIKKKIMKKKKSRRESSTSVPLLLRLLITVFPLLSSWTKMLSSTTFYPIQIHMNLINNVGRNIFGGWDEADYSRVSRNY